ncbi:hypothetical protein HN784_05215 [bacterium]|jgi:hypothetical protein|nr:hypothetical protein [bacterium]MBT4250767.1 hypothetical protein [bacterium]MBT4598211.1 hypothetical protein [bacterium]MBT6753809.1 hypothetical protein [bacterium]MBT7037478.1 hypothetical protein [bacterium]
MIQKKNILKIAKNSLFNFLRFLGTKTWFFTVLFFGAVLAVSIWIWWQCVYQPKPSMAVMEKIEREREDFDGMKKNTMEAITLLQEYRNNYNNAPKFENQRELFIDLLDESVIEEINKKDDVIIKKEENILPEGIEEQQEIQAEEVEVETETPSDQSENNSLKDVILNIGN